MHGSRSGFRPASQGHDKSERARPGALDLFSLNAPQRRAVLHNDGPMLVLAGAGSGKTRVIIYRIARLMADGVPPESILAVTFTNKAAAEMRSRLSALVGNKAKLTQLSTFHALGLKIIKAEHEAAGLPKNFCIYDASDQLSLMRDLLRHFTVADRRLDAQRLLDVVVATKRAGLDEVQIDWGDDYELAALEIYPKYLAQMRAFGAIDFDDLITLAHKVLQQPEVQARWQGRFSYILVDEYQDTSQDQLALLLSLSDAQRNLCVVGDDDQAIYGWRGAATDNILGFCRTFTNVNEVVLDQNYRSTQPILTVANHVIAKNLVRRAKTLWSAKVEGEPVSVTGCASDDDEAEWVAQTVHQIVADGGALDDIAVLYRANSQSRILQEVLCAERLAHRVLGGQALFDRKDVRDGMAFLTLAHNLRDEVALRRVINVPPRGLGPATLERLGSYAKANNISLWQALSQADKIDGLTSGARAGAASLVGTLTSHRQALTSNSSGSCGDAAEDYLTSVGLRDSILAANDTANLSAARLANLDAVVASLRRYANRHKESSDESGGGSILSGFLRAAALRGSSDSQTDEPSSTGELTLMTLHAAKGLEFPYVILVGLEENLLPHRRAVEDTSAAAAQSLSEERRLLYVGMTRAKVRLWLSYAKERVRHGRRVAQTPSRFLDDLPGTPYVERHERRHGDTQDMPGKDSERLAADFFAKMRAQLGIEAGA